MTIGKKTITNAGRARMTFKRLIVQLTRTDPAVINH